MKFKTIFSADLVLRIITPQDVDMVYVRWLQNTQVNKYLEARLENISLNSQKNFVANILESTDTCLFGIFVEDNKMIGTIKIGPIDYKTKSAEIGLVIGEPDYWGKGYGTKAIEMMCESFFEKEFLTTITAGVYSGNIGSRKAFENNGFVSEKYIQNSEITINGELQQVIRYRKTSGQQR